MNTTLFIRNLIIIILFAIPVFLIFLKIKINSSANSYINKIYDLMSDNNYFYREKYTCASFETFKTNHEDQLDKYPDLLKDYESFLETENKLSKKLSFYEKIVSITSISFFDDGWYTVYCVVAWFSFVVTVIGSLFFISEFFSEKKFYQNSTYPSYVKFIEYEELPNWKVDAKRWIKEAEDFNVNYFSTNGKILNVMFIIPDENGNYPILDDDGKPTGKYLEPINTNQMCKSFLKICQDEKEVIK